MLITSKTNKTYQQLLKIKKGHEDYLLIEGEDLISLAYKNKSLVTLISYEYIDQYLDIKHVELTKNLYINLSSYNSLPKVMGVAEYKMQQELNGDEIIYLDGIQDPGNLGTLFRSALAFNFKEIALSDKCVSPFNFKAVAASKGSIFDLKIAKLDLQYFKDKNYHFYVTSLQGDDILNIKKLIKPYVLVLGSEGQGVSKKALELSDDSLYIPIEREIDSLNVGVAGGITMFYFRSLK